MDYALYLRALLSLVFVLGLLLLCFWILKRLHLFQGSMAPSRTRRLRIVETLLIDGRHRAVLLRRDDAEHLVLLGPASTTLIETSPITTDITAP
jgi:flagellar protein FliO/FliZ